MTTNPAEDLRAAMSALGLDYAGPIAPDGKLHRFKCEGDGDASAWYVLYPPDPISAGAFGCWRRQISEKWHQKNGELPKGRDLAEMQRKWKEAEAQRSMEERDRHIRISERAAESTKSFGPPDVDHTYLLTKKVKAWGGIRQNPDGELVLPLRDAAGKVWSLQTIDIFGDKLFMPGGRVQGCYYEVCSRADGPLVICEGYATGASIFEATGWATVCAMNCGNLMAVARSIRDLQPNRIIILAADNDRFTKDQSGAPKNPGVEKASDAAKAIKGLLAVPKFPESSLSGTDYNDLAFLEGSSSVQVALESVAGMGIGTRISISQLLGFDPAADPECVIGNRYLCKGGSLIIIGQTHVGKSSFGLQMAVTLCLGGDFFGIGANPVRPLKCVFIQAENDLGDMAEMFQGILMGTGQLSDSKERNIELAKVLRENLIIVRDQVHTGSNFASACRKLIQIHNPDLLFFDPLLSFYGDDINDQKAAGEFLRGQLNPISEETGVIWVALHHTGKPMKDAAKTTKSWNTADFSYMGLGSSEFSNWPRATITIVSAGEDEFRVILGKRGWRAGAKDELGNPTNDLYLAHSSDHICWKQIPKPKDSEETEGMCSMFARQIDPEPKSARDILALAEAYLKRGRRTLWKMWDRGTGPLGIHFKRDADTGLYYSAQTPPAARPYSNDD